MCNIYLVMHNSVQMTILLLLNFIIKEQNVLFTFSLERTTNDTNNITHMFSLLMVNFKEFYALRFDLAICMTFSNT